MRVTPWNHYPLVEQESDSDLYQSDSGLHLASNKNPLMHGCTPYLFFGRAAAGLGSSRHLKVGPTHHAHSVLKSPDSGKVKEKICHLDLDDDDDDIHVRSTCLLRSNLRRPPRTISVFVVVYNESEGEGKIVNQHETNGVDHTERRVQWTNVSGGELFMVREFEPSEHNGSDDEFENGNERSCSFYDQKPNKRAI